MKERVEIRLEGGNFAAFLSAVSNEGVKTDNIRNDGTALVLRCFGKDEDLLKKTAAKYGLSCETVCRKGWRSGFAGMLRHAGATAAAVLTIASFAVSRFFVFAVAVEGTSPQRAAQIISVLAEAGIDGVMPKSSVDASEIEKIVLNGSDDLAFAEARIDGTRLVVSVREQIPERVQTNEEGKIVSSCDAIVTRVEVSGGTAAVKAGDTVRKGQTLIEDHIVVGDPLDPEHKELTVAAEGDVYGRVWYTERLMIPVVRTLSVRTGRTYSSTSLYIGDGLVLSAKADHGFVSFEKTSETKKMNGILPVTLVTDTYYETEEVLVETDEAYLESEAYASFARLYAELDPSSAVLASYKSQKKVDNYYIIILYYEIEQLIGCREA